MFQKFSFTRQQVEQYYRSAKRDFSIARRSAVLEVKFRFGYDALLKLAIAVCAHSGLKVRSHAGHHLELIDKLAEIIKFPEVEIFGNQLRSKRNLDLYDGRLLITEKEMDEYLGWLRKVFDRVEEVLFGRKKLC